MFPYDALPSLSQLAVAVPAIGAGYIIFGLVGFGTVFIAAPVLVYTMPLAGIVPLLAIMDCVATTSNGIRLGEKVARGELVWILPMMVLGSMLGAWLLLNIPPRPMMGAFGAFVIVYALYGLFAPTPSGHISRGWVIPCGGIGGMLSAMFGSGGIVYAMYLSRRLADKDAIRATQSALLSFATFTRVVIFTLAGVYSDLSLPLLALCLAPPMVLGMWIGEHITMRLTREQFLRVLHIIMVGAGGTLLARAIGAG